MTYRGFSLVEVLVAGVIGGVIVLGSVESLRFSMQAGAVSRTILTENDFKLTVSRALVDNCYGNLKPTKLTGSDNTKGIGEVGGLKLVDSESADFIIEKGTFKGDIEVVKMEVTGDSSKDCPDTGCKRDFVAYYKKTNLGDLNTASGLSCENDPDDLSKLNGCFKAQCQLEYILDDPDTTDTEGRCESLTCHPVVLMAGVGSRFPCPWGHLYNPDHKTTNKPKCEDRNKKIEGQTDCNDVPPEKALGSSWRGSDHKRNKVVDPNDPDRCICKGGYGADGNIGVLNRFFLTAEGLCFGNFGAEHCLSINSPDEETFKKYCSREYQGARECVKWRDKYHKRVYNRETGQVVCVSSEGQKVKVTLDENGRRLSMGHQFTIPPPPRWFMPPMQ